VAASDPNFTANPYLFTGRRFDCETGLYYYRARYYNPYIGPFLQTDPVGYSAGMNLYTYCGNNPLVLTDPSGRNPYDSNDSNDATDWSDWLNVRAYAEQQRDLAEASKISDVEALARIADKVAEWSKRWYLGKSLETLKFVRGLGLKQVQFELTIVV
jgi:RHS repeat-associated protein